MGVILADDLTKHGQSVYSVVVAAAKRARAVNDWRIQRARVLLEETLGPKATVQAIEELHSGEVTCVVPEK